MENYLLDEGEIHKNCAFCDQYFKFAVVLGMVSRCKKSIANINKSHKGCLRWFPETLRPYLQLKNLSQGSWLLFIYNVTFLYFGWMIHLQIQGKWVLEVSLESLKSTGKLLELDKEFSNSFSLAHTFRRNPTSFLSSRFPSRFLYSINLPLNKSILIPRATKRHLSTFAPTSHSDRPTRDSHTSVITADRVR